MSLQLSCLFRSRVWTWARREGRSRGDGRPAKPDVTAMMEDPEGPRNHGEDSEGPAEELAGPTRAS